jgi:hypothetical protein
MFSVLFPAFYGCILTAASDFLRPQCSLGVCYEYEDALDWQSASLGEWPNRGTVK